MKFTPVSRAEFIARIVNRESRAGRQEIIDRMPGFS